VPVRLLAILGPSGCGKSSVAQAGLLAALDERPLPGRPAAPSVVFTPEARPVESLAVALARHVTGDPAPVGKASEFEKVLRERRDGDGLRFLAETLGKAGIVLLVDQFEETYALCQNESERDAFIRNLMTAARAPDGRVSIVLTLRSDFLGAINQHPELSGLIARQNVVVPVMGEDELRRAIGEPAKAAGEEIDQSTVDLLIEQTRGREGALPALEFVLTRIWDGFLNGATAAETVRALGGVGGALANQAQTVYDSLGRDERPIARRAFLAMVRLGEGTKDSRRRVSVDEIVTTGQSRERVLKVISAFADRRLVVLGVSEGAASRRPRWPMKRCSITGTVFETGSIKGGTICASIAASRQLRNIGISVVDPTACSGDDRI
jgi:Novel STAND NTPase 1